MISIKVLLVVLLASVFVGCRAEVASSGAKGSADRSSSQRAASADAAALAAQLAISEKRRSISVRDAEEPGGGSSDSGGSSAVGGKVRQHPPVLQPVAQQPIHIGKTKETLQSLLAYALTNEKGAAELLPSFRWVPSLRRPVLAIHWGIAVQVIASREFTGSPQPIGSTQEFKGLDGRSNGATDDEASDAAGESPLTSVHGGSDAGDEAAEEGIGLGAFRKWTGEFGELLLEELGVRVANGSFGDVLVRGAAQADVHSIPPGITYLGTSDRIDAPLQFLAQARDAHIDVLALFRVTIEMNHRRGFTSNMTIVSLYNPAKGVSDGRLVWTRPLSNVGVQVARERGKNGRIESEVAKISRYIDGSLSLVPLPAALNADNVERHVTHLISLEHADMLSVLAEISFWNRQGYLSDKAKVEAFATLLGNDTGQQLASGTESEKQAAIARWLPGHQVGQ